MYILCCCVYRSHASMLGADILYIEAMQACLGPIYCISSHASLLEADILYIEALQACLELIYCISSPNFPAPTETGGESRKIRQPGYNHSAPSGTVWRANAIRPYMYPANLAGIPDAPANFAGVPDAPHTSAGRLSISCPAARRRMRGTRSARRAFFLATRSRQPSPSSVKRSERWLSS